VANEITEEVHATPYPAAPNIVIAYPSPSDWVRLYDRNKWHDIRWWREHYKDMSRSHLHSVTQQLDLVFSRTTGRAVCAELKARSSYSVMIFPFDFLPRELWGPKLGAVTRPVELQAAWAAGLPMAGAGATGTRVTSGLFGHGTGSAVDMYFTASRIEEMVETADEVLLHELVHASRVVKGIKYNRPVSGGYGNLEEFLAMLVENIYRSEKGRPPVDYQSNPINARSILDFPSVGALIRPFRNNQPALYYSLQNIRTSFNPIRDFEAKEKH
jgi:hypothetical protein